MYLKSLELNGFKSFGNKSILEFNSPVTSIVVPNGSGKSNVAEAFRFVLGEQSIKSMRGKKGEDLIFNGADSGGRSNRASVKVTFDNSSRFLSLDVDEVVIERTVFRDGSNEYHINGSQSRLKDVLELLASAHIGSSGHHIISQGEADRILNANSKDRKSMIEDALGLKSYQYKKTESIRKLEKTEENIKEIELSRREIAPHIKFLKRQVQKIEQAMQMKVSLGDLYNEYLKREDIYLAFEKEEIENGLKEPLSKKNDLEHKLKEAREVLENAKKEDEKSKRFIEIDKNLSVIRERKGDMERDLGRVEGEIASLRRILEAEKRKQESEDHRMIELSSVNNLHKRIDVLITDAESETTIEKLQKTIQEIKTVLKEFSNNQKDTRESVIVSDFIKDIESLESQIKTKEEDIKNLSIEEERLVSEYEKVKKEIEEEKDSNRDAEKAVFQIMAELNHLETILTELYARKRSFEREKELFEGEIREGIVLVGERLKEYHGFRILDENENPVTKEMITAEDREKQLERRKAIEKLKIRLEDAGAGGGDEVLKEYDDVTARDQFLIKELEDLNEGKSKLEELIKDLEERIDKEFKEGILKINKEFSNLFGIMFGGGEAKLSVIKQEKRKKKVDEEALELDENIEEELEDGVEIMVSLPRKKIKGLMMLSGGERALTSIALLFAMSQVNPPPFIILDETDAALDEANSRKYGDMIENLSKYSQLILITHNRETMSRAGILYGVTMSSNGVSKLLSIAFTEAVKVAK